MNNSVLTAIVISLLPVMVLSAVGDPCVQKVDCGVQEYEQCCGFVNGNLSSCIDTRYQQCCPNTACQLYASCCNDTCCSDRESCMASSTVEGSRDICSSIEHLNPGAFFASVILPIIFVISAVIAFGFAATMVYIHRTRWTLPALFVATISTIVFFFACSLLVSPFALPALFITSVATLCLASLAATSDPLAPTPVLSFAIIATIIAFLLTINPLASNSLLSFSPQYPAPAPSADATHATGGVVGGILASLSPAALRAANNDAGLVGFTSCPSYYGGYFRRDPALYSDARIHDQDVAAEPYGLCGRDYILWTAVAATVIAGLLPVLILGLVARLLEVRGVNVAWPLGAQYIQPSRPATAKIYPSQPQHPQQQQQGGYYEHGQTVPTATMVLPQPADGTSGH